VDGNLRDVTPVRNIRFSFESRNGYYKMLNSSPKSAKPTWESPSRRAPLVFSHGAGNHICLSILGRQACTVFFQWWGRRDSNLIRTAPAVLYFRPLYARDFNFVKNLSSKNSTLIIKWMLGSTCLSCVKKIGLGRLSSDGSHKTVRPTGEGLSVPIFIWL
jgi:hypothetical protein